MGILDLLIINHWITALVVLSSLWVAVDASALNVRKGKLSGSFLDMGVVGWFFSCLLLWIVGFPAYLSKRAEYKRLKDLEDSKGSPSNDPTEMIRKLAELHQAGILDDEEFLQKKQELLGKV